MPLAPTYSTHVFLFDSDDETAPRAMTIEDAALGNFDNPRCRVTRAEVVHHPSIHHTEVHATGYILGEGDVPARDHMHLVALTPEQEREFIAACGITDAPAAEDD